MRVKIPDFKIGGVKFRFNQNRRGKTAFKPKKGTMTKVKRLIQVKKYHVKMKLSKNIRDSEQAQANSF
jgi:hypothetical protein